MLIKRLQDDLTTSDVHLSDVLRGMKLLAVELASEDLQQWATNELVGYEDETKIPSYRILRVQAIGVFAGFGGSRDQRVLPASQYPKAIKESAMEVRLIQPIAAIEALARAPDDDARMEWPQEWVMGCRSKFSLSNGMELISAHSPITHADLYGVLDSVRTCAMEFIIGLRQKNPDVVKSDDALSEMRADDVRQVFNLTVTGGTAIIAAGHSVNQSATATVAPGDIRALIEALLARGVDRADAEALQTAVSGDGPPSKRQLGPQVSAWYAKMVSKAASGAWQLAVETAAPLLSGALGKCYGWS